MEFDSNKPIYLQIADSLCDRILKGEVHGGDRLPSVRELGAQLGVNPNTIVRSYESLAERKIIYNKRGIGFFVSLDASNLVLESEREKFINEEFPRMLNRAKMLDINITNLL